MKLYSIALLLAFAYAQEEGETTETTTETTEAPAEEVEEEPYMKQSDFVWATDSVVQEARDKDNFSQGVPSDAKGSLNGVTSNYTIMEDADGAAWVKVTMTAGWDTVWESSDNSQWNGYNGNLGMTVQNTAFEGEGDSWEWATISASRVKSDKKGASGKSLQWGSLVQGSWAGPDGLNWGATGAAAFAEGAQEFTPTAWGVTGDQTETRGETDGRKGKRYITGMGASAQRKLDAGEASQLVIKNGMDTPYCASAWLNNDDGKWGWGWKACSAITVDMPVEETENKTEEDGAANLTASLMAIAALFALNY